MVKFVKVLFLILLFAPVSAYAGDISISAGVDRQSVTLSEYVVYTVTVRGDTADLPSPKLADIYGFKLYGSSTSKSVSMINGAVNVSVSYIYSLVPQTTGKFTIPPATVEYKGTTYYTDPIDVEVTVAKSIQNVNAPASNAGGGRRRQPASSSVTHRSDKEKVFVKASVGKKTAYVNEKIIYTFVFYTNVNLLSNPAYEPPAFTGFFNDGTKPFNRYETIDGQNYQVSGLEYTLYPIESGKKTIPPAKIRIAVADVPDADDFNTLVANMMAGMGMGQGRTINLQTEPLTVNVLPLPEKGKPDGFSGAVGNFKIIASADRNEVKTGGTVTISLKVSGKGNMRSVNPIAFDLGNDFKQYDTIVAKASDGLKEFQTIIMPLLPGEKIIPKMRLHYFNPETQKYEFSETDEIRIKVSGTPVLQDNAAASAAAQQQIKSDMRYNKEISTVCSYCGPLLTDKRYLLIFLPFLLLLAVSYFYRMRKDMINSDPALKMKYASRANMEMCLVKARKDMSDGRCNDFYDSVYKAVTEAANVRTGTDCGPLNALQIYEKLVSAGVSETEASKIKALLDKINFYRFASVKSDEKAMNEVLAEAENVVKEIGK